MALSVTVLTPPSAGFVSVYPTGEARSNTTLASHAASEVRAGGGLFKLGTSGRIDVYPSSGAEIIVDVTGSFLPAENARSGRYVPASPSIRIYDRSNILEGRTRTFAVPSWVPADATAAMINVTAVENANNTFLSANPGSQGIETSFLNVGVLASPTSASTVVRLTNRTFKIYASNDQKVLIDFSGYFTGAGSGQSSAGLFSAINPTRVVDTRINPPGLYPGGTLEMLADFDIAATANNWTIIPTSSSAFLTTYAARTARPGVSTVNAKPGTPATGGAIDRMSTKGIAFYANQGTAVLADVTGFFYGSPRQTTTGPAPNDSPTFFVAPFTAVFGGYGPVCFNGSCSTHIGHDMFGYGSNPPIYPLAAGTVVKVRPGGGSSGGGNIVTVRHGATGYYSRYHHLDRIEVTVGEDITTQDRIGTEGETGTTGGDHLHLEIWDRNWGRHQANGRLFGSNGQELPVQRIDGHLAHALSLTNALPQGRDITRGEPLAFDPLL